MCLGGITGRDLGAHGSDVAAVPSGRKGIDASAIRGAVSVFYERLLADPALSDMWKGTDMPRLRAHQRAFLLQALGGPALYSGRDMKVAHAGLAITDEQFTLTLGHLLTSLTEVGVTADVVERASVDLESLRQLIVEM